MRSPAILHKRTEGRLLKYHLNLSDTSIILCQAHIILNVILKAFYELNVGS